MPTSTELLGRCVIDWGLTYCRHRRGVGVMKVNELKPPNNLINDY